MADIAILSFFGFVLLYGISASLRPSSTRVNYR